MVGKHEGQENPRGCGINSIIPMSVRAESIDSSDKVVGTMKDHESHETAHTYCPMLRRR